LNYYFERKILMFNLDIGFTTHFVYWLVLALICGLYLLYWESLWDKSHQIILDMQKDHSMEDETSKVAHMEFIDDITDGGQYYIILPFLLYPFVCRQRFFYYLFAMSTAAFWKSATKLMYSAPRPAWVWTDL
jgi:hypothetical protein